MPSTKQTLVDIGLLLTRATIGLYLTLAGIHKCIGEFKNGFGSFYRSSFKGLQPGWLPDALAAPYGYVLPWIEVVIGALLMLGLFGKIAAALTGLMILSFTIALAMKMGIRAQPGDAPSPFSANYIQIAACFLLTFVGPGRFSLDALIRKKK
jgi:uncharacterized membrane protein YphA (DoxX/SURF4 family)